MGCERRGKGEDVRGQLVQASHCRGVLEQLAFAALRMAGRVGIHIIPRQLARPL